MRTCRAKSVRLLGGSRLTSLSSTRRDRYILPWLFSIRYLGRRPVVSRYFHPIGQQPPSKTGDWLRATRSCDYPMWTAPPPARTALRKGLPMRWPRIGGASMKTVTTIGLDIAKSVFQVHGIDAEGKVVVRRQLKRAR